jgi:hypothetical protein
MAQDLLARDQEQEGEWDEIGAWAGWEEIALGLVPVGIVFAPVVEREFLIRQVLLVMT